MVLTLAPQASRPSGDSTAAVSLWHGLADKVNEDHTNIEENNRTAAYTWLLNTVSHQSN